MLHFRGTKEEKKGVEDPLKKKVTKEEVEDFLRVIKNSEYSVVKHLNVRLYLGISPFVRF